jgi:hypothetical protein
MLFSRSHWKRKTTTVLEYCRFVHGSGSGKLKTIDDQAISIQEMNDFEIEPQSFFSDFSGLIPPLVFIAPSGDVGGNLYS